MAIVTTGHFTNGFSHADFYLYFFHIQCYLKKKGFPPGRKIGKPKHANQ